LLNCVEACFIHLMPIAVCWCLCCPFLLLPLLLLLPGHGADDLIAADEDEDDKFAIVFAAMGVNMETAHFFKQVRESLLQPAAAFTA
jgi:hypothetical protein